MTNRMMLAEAMTTCLTATGSHLPPLAHSYFLFSNFNFNCRRVFHQKNIWIAMESKKKVYKTKKLPCWPYVRYPSWKKCKSNSHYRDRNNSWFDTFNEKKVRVKINVIYFHWYSLLSTTKKLHGKIIMNDCRPINHPL